MRAVQISEFGGPEVLELVELPDPDPAEGEVVVAVSRSGVNFADTHVTRDDYLARQTLPFVPGAEVVGTTADGRRVAAMIPGGGYAQQVAVPEASLVAVPDQVDDETAAGMLLAGVTAHALIHRCARLEPGESIVIEAAAGGTGSLAVQLAKRAGARVIALASTEAKRELAISLGADATVDSRTAELGEAILAANGGEQVDAVLQMSGGDAFDQELRVVAPFGRVVAFGIASREQNSVRTGQLMRSSRAVIGFWLIHLLAQPSLVTETLEDLFSAVLAEELRIVIGGVYPLTEAAQAHRDLADRRTTGKLLLDPAG